MSAVARHRTYRGETPIGTALITVKHTVDGEPCEVSVQVGEDGSDVRWMAEALGHLVSFVLRMPSSVSPRQRLEQVVDQLVDIGGRQTHGFGGAQVRSLPDVVARTLSAVVNGGKEPM
jgi:ribonucleoside-diphosphate reductase alpha chain